MYMITFLLLITACATPEPRKPQAYAKHEGCWSQKRGSTPVCWTEQDWQIYCERVECKETK